MKKIVLITIIWLMGVYGNQPATAQRTFTMQTAVPAPSGDYYRIKLMDNGSPTIACKVGEIALFGNALYRCAQVDTWQILDGVWTQDDNTETVYFSALDTGIDEGGEGFIPEPPNLGLVLGDTQKEFMLTVIGGGIISKGTLGSGETLNSSGANETRLIWYPRKGAFRVGSAGGAGTDAWNDANIGNYSFVAGLNNRATTSYSVVSGGQDNQVTLASHVTIGGGFGNLASGNSSTISGGLQNVANAIYSTIGGGQTNRVTAAHATVGGGWNNRATGAYSFVGGGGTNFATAQASTIAGGDNNQATGTYSFIGGGVANRATGPYSVVLGGNLHDNAGSYASILGGFDNDIPNTGNYSTILGGNNVEVSGSNSVAFGSSLNATGDNSFVFATYTGTPQNVDWDDAFVVLAGKTAIGHKNNVAGQTLPGRLNVWRDSTAANEVAIYIDDILQIKPRDTAPTCSGAADQGKIYMDTTDALCVCTISNQWMNLTAKGTCN